MERNEKPNDRQVQEGPGVLFKGRRCVDLDGISAALSARATHASSLRSLDFQPT